MKTIIFSVAVFAFLLFNAAAQQVDYSQLRASAESEYSRKSYARAHEIYARIDKSKLTASELRWVEFRLADTSWRAQAATETPDNTKFEEARKQLEELIRVADKDTDHDLVWAEAHESLGDLFWTRRNDMNWQAAWPHYHLALDWWAGQRDLELARTRYLAIVFRCAVSPSHQDYYYYNYYGASIPLNILENALKISVSANDRSHLNFLIAITMRQQVGAVSEAHQRLPERFEEALKAGKQSPWYDDALYHYAEWMNSNGGVREVAEGQWQYQPDYVKALELYRRLTTEFSAGETRYFDQAKFRIIEITTPNLGVAVSNIFLPDSELQFGLMARNIQRVQFSLYKVDMTRDIPYADTDQDLGTGMPNSWIHKMSTAGRQSAKTWTRNVDTADYKPVSEQVRVEGKLPVGAYVLEAKGDSGLSARELILVSDATIVLKSSGKQALVFFSNALTSAPIANANVTLWESYHHNGDWRWRRMRQTTNADGLAHFSLQNLSSINLYATAASNDRQAFAAGYGN
ncbi:MAG TPA: hypothetical protein VHH35_21255, partial [Pyrinomonadaceae bacterium]|nr:hypothetical protein [Pyrinomonadaceae bacterium]